MGDLVYLHTETDQDIPPERVIAGAAERKFQRVAVIGVTEDNELYIASSSGPLETTMTMIDLAKIRLLRIADSTLT